MGYTGPYPSRIAQRQRLDADAALELTAAILEATGETAGWETFVRRFGEILGGVAPGLYINDGATPILHATPDADPGWKRAYDEHFIACDVRRPHIQALPARAVYIGQDLVDDRELCRSEFFNDFLRPQGFFHALGAVVLKESGRIGVLRVMRPQSRPFAEAERSFVQRILPHLVLALHVQWRLDAVRAERDANAEVLDRFDGGVVLLDRCGHVLAANRYAESLLRRADGLLRVHGSLITSAPRDGVLLRRLIDAVASRDATRPEAAGGALNVQRPSGRAPYNVLVSPLSAPWLATAPRHAAVAVWVTDPERGRRPDRDSVCRYLGLTPAEGDVVLALARGLSPADVARERGISLNTVRTHVKRSLAKADVRRQADLVRLVLSGPSGLGLRRG